MPRPSQPVNTTLAQRIAEVRMMNNESQEQFGVRVAEYLHRNRVYTVPAVSAWETGRRGVPAKVVIAVSELYNVSVDYLTGSSNAYDEESGIDLTPGISREEIRKLSDSKISSVNLVNYNRKPVFIVFPTMVKKNQWGILDIDNGTVTLMRETISLDSAPMDFYPLQTYLYPEYNRRIAHSLSIKSFKASDRFWVEICSTDDENRALYNGWYTHNKNHTAIVNLSNGMVLPESGFNISYKAYKDPYDTVY